MSAAWLNALHKFVNHGLVPGQVEDELVSILLTEYLRIESGDGDKAAFLAAALCLAAIESDAVLGHLTALHEGRRPYVQRRIDGDATTVSPPGLSGLTDLLFECDASAVLRGCGDAEPRDRIQRQ
jgi:hypothetical protein